MVSHLCRPPWCGPSPNGIRLMVRTSHHEDLDLLRAAPCWRRGPPPLGAVARRADSLLTLPILGRIVSLPVLPRSQERFRAHLVGRVIGGRHGVVSQLTWAIMA